ncbi:Dehydrogenase reductase SDR member 1 [Parelaphostrongylus tenuis]|uniref:Dehydrogenase reductase SDR member 1 n=1 Tax=Parelaphostrongylus tenuis TaxID=148309 RepID=A0AAD5QK23_PARTN|nr:Dehydrogenase reductase SDR member 1 [Parelaphostrongylus tenuis]
MIDRMSADMAVELKQYGVSIVSLWPGMVKTELSEMLRDENKLEKMVQQSRNQLDRAFKQSESTESVGKAIVALAADAKVQKESGKVLMTDDLANEYGFKDIDGEEMTCDCLIVIKSVVLPVDSTVMKFSISFLPNTCTLISKGKLSTVESSAFFEIICERD